MIDDGYVGAFLTPGLAQNKKGSKKQVLNFTIDCTVLVNDELLDTASFEKFLADRIKVNGKAGNLGDAGGFARS